MTIEEKRAVITLVLFGVLAAACGVLLVVGPERLGCNDRQLYLICLTLTAVAHVGWIAQYRRLRRRRESGEAIQDERDQAIHATAVSVGRCACCVVFFTGCMALAMTESYRGDGLVEAETLFGLVLLCSIVAMLSRSICGVVLYRRY